MKILEFKNLMRKESPLSYRREFHAEAVFELMSGLKGKRVTFIIEQKPVGASDIHVEFLEDPDYPLLPAVRTVKDYIRFLEKEGGLP